MNPIRKLCLSLKRLAVVGTPNPVVSIGAITEDTVNCYGQISLKVTTNALVKVQISGVFGQGGSWLAPEFLGGINKVSAPLTETISSIKTYSFGIDGNISGTLSSVSVITVDVRKNDTNELIQTFNYSRTHSTNPC